MRLHFKETKNADYQNYEFPYKVYATREDSDSVESMYEQGFLQTRIEKEYYYLARGVRIKLEDFELNSENRRILRKTEYMEMAIASLRDFEYDHTIGKFAKDYYDSRFGPKTLSPQKMKWIFTSGAFTDVLIFRDKSNGEIIGYCPVLMTNEIMHYAYPFFQLSYMEKNLGIGMMTAAIQYAQEKGLKYVYLGTCYSEQALYKTQFDGVQWFDGETWSDDLEQLKQLCRN
ncbi:MAG: GNAT family N-acetyltransferase [Candidatus Dojkabacteria bacterium]|nr:MAG: GNAT family N-acetyltransferase [Candidatus Dojkabacteria bacterium]